jgi:hypothetical protein
MPSANWFSIKMCLATMTLRANPMTAMIATMTWKKNKKALENVHHRRRLRLLHHPRKREGSELLPPVKRCFVPRIVISFGRSGASKKNKRENKLEN